MEPTSKKTKRGEKTESCNKLESSNNIETYRMQTSEDLLFEEEELKEFRGSAVDFSPGNILGSKPQSTPSSSGKKSFKKISLGAVSSLPLGNNSDEESEEEGLALKLDNLKLGTNTLHEPVEPQNSFVKSKSTTLEEIADHISRCLQLHTENKINLKNAFALKLIDYMGIALKEQDNNDNDFAAVACQLDAGTKIYCNRVDAVHQEVVKLAESCILAEERGTKEKQNDDDSSAEEEGMEVDDSEKDPKRGREHRLKAKKKILASPDQITRKLKGRDPRSNYVQLEARPGGILEKAIRDPKDLSLSLKKDMPFWPDWGKPATRSIEMIPFPSPELIPNLIARVKAFRETHKLIADLPTIFPDTQSYTCGSDDEQPSTSSDGAINMLSYSSDEQNDNITEDPGNPAETNELRIISMAESRMMNDLKSRPTKIEVIKALFCEPGESDYDYFKMSNVHYWAGPSYWKRPQGAAALKKKTLRKKKEPVEIKYSNDTGEFMSHISSKRSIVLSKKTLMNWKVNKVTYPPDIHFESEELFKLFNINSKAILSPHDQDDQVNSEHIQALAEQENEEINRTADNYEDEDEQQWDGGNFSSVETESRLPCETAANDLDEYSSIKGMQKLSTHDKKGDAGSSCNLSTSSDSYEGENLVPMVKMVKVEPIRCIARPNRVNFQHLKEVMMEVIKEKILESENKENQCQATVEGVVTFKDVMYELYNSGRLQSLTQEDLTPAMGFFALMTLANEHALNLQQATDVNDVPLAFEDVSIRFSDI